MRCWSCKKEGVEEIHWTNVRPLCKECYDKPRHRYYYLNRPPAIGCQPDGFIDRESWMPAKPQLLIGKGRDPWHVLGWVEYPEPLAAELVWKWELWPHEAAQVSIYLDRREENGR